LLLGGFSGLPSPAAGIVIASLPNLLSPIPVFDIKFSLLTLPGNPLYIATGFFIVIAFLMVSSIDYSKLFSTIYSKGKVPVILTISSIVLMLIFWQMWATFFVTTFYVIYGIFVHFYKMVVDK